jgi:transcriptional regulator with XRE-family HTH domain
MSVASSQVRATRAKTTAAPEKTKRVRTEKAAKPPAYDLTLAVGELAMPGGTLFAVLMGRRAQLDHNLDEVAERLGVSAGHLQLLRSGRRELRSITPELLDRMAEYTGLPRGYFMIMAGIVRPEDFDFTPMEAQIDRAIAAVARDPEWGKVAPNELRAAPMALKRLVVRLYERASERTLVEPIVGSSADPFTFIQNLTRAGRYQLPNVSKGSTARRGAAQTARAAVRGSRAAAKS